MSSSISAPSRRRRSAVVALLAVAALGLGLSIATPPARAKVEPTGTPGGHPVKHKPGKQAPTVPMPPGAPGGTQTPPLGELPPKQVTATQNAAQSGDLPALSMDDPFCAPGLTAQQQQNCRVSGSVSAPYPISSYGLDYLNPPTGVGSLSLGDDFASALGATTSVIWNIWLYLIHGVLVVLNWAFTLRLVQDAMGVVKQGLSIMHNDVFGVSWLEAAIAVVGLWAIWNGLVRRRTIETVAGLAVTVALMLGALLVIAEPDATVGRLSTFADQASLTALSAVSRANVAQPARGFAAAEGNLFTALVERPWCALEFGDVPYCTAPRGSTTVADIWLAFGAMGPGRQGLYNLATTGNISQYGGFLGSVGKALGLISSVPVITVAQACSSAPNGRQCAALKAAQALSCWGKKGGSTCAFSAGQSNRVSMQAGGNPFTRMALLFMITLGLVPAVCVLLYLAIHLVFAAIMTLILLLGMPVMLLVAAFGESGRTTAIAYNKRLVGAALTKLVFAVLLAIIVLMAMAINSLRIGWFSVWMLNVIFFWGVLIKRKQMIGFLTMDKRIGDAGYAVGGDGTQSPFRLWNIYAGLRMAQAGIGLARGAARLPRAVSRGRAERRTADSAALRQEYGNELAGRAGQAIGIEDNGRRATAQAEVNAYNRRRTSIEGLREQKALVSDRLQTYNGELRKEGLKPIHKRMVTAQRDLAKVRLANLNLTMASEQDQLHADQGTFNRATSTLESMRERNRAEDPRELRREVEQREADVAPGQSFPTDLPADRPRLERSLRWAGIEPTAFDSATPAVQRRFLDNARNVWQRDRDLSGRLSDPRARDGLPDTRAENRQGWSETGTRGRDRPARIRSAQELQVIRDNRRHAGRSRSRRGLR